MLIYFLFSFTIHNGVNSWIESFKNMTLGSTCNHFHNELDIVPFKFHWHATVCGWPTWKVTPISISSSSSLDWSFIMLMIVSFHFHAGHISAVICHTSSSPTPESGPVSLGTERLPDIDHSCVGTPWCIKCCCLVSLNLRQGPTNIQSLECTERNHFQLPLHLADVQCLPITCI